MKLPQILLACCCMLGAAFAAVETGTECPLTRINSFPKRCNITGWIRDPYPLAGPLAANSSDACAAICFANDRCASFKYVLESSRCYTYSEILDNMSFSKNSVRPGRLFDRNCYSTDCNAIAACNDVAPHSKTSCHHVTFETYYDIYIRTEYACGYGIMPKSPGDRDARVKYLPGNLSNCAAVGHCDSDLFDVYYHIPTDRWVCTEYTVSSGAIFAGRYTERDDSVGAFFSYVNTDEREKSP